MWRWRRWSLPGVGVRCPPVEFGLELIIRCCCGWLSTLEFEVALFIVVIDRLAELWVCAKWWSRGGDTGSDFTLIAIGDVLGGGVLFDTARWDRLWHHQMEYKKKKQNNMQSLNPLINEFGSNSAISTNRLTYFVWCKLLIFWWFQFDKLITSLELIEKSWAPNELNAGYGRPLIPGVCNATTGVFMDDCCRCYSIEIKEHRQFVWIFAAI